MRCYVKRVVLYALSAMLTLLIINIVSSISLPDDTDNLTDADIPKPTESHTLRITEKPVHSNELHNSQTNQLKGKVPSVVDEFEITSDASKVWPVDHKEKDNRIPAQMSYVPRSAHKQEKNKLILRYDGLNLPKGDSSIFQQLNCPVQTCTLTEDQNDGPVADAIIWGPRSPTSMILPSWQKPIKQVWVLYTLESPANTPSLRDFNGLVNWTATYRHDSILPAPYEQFVPYNAETLRKLNTSSRDYALGKTKKVAWIVSNCNAQNGRMEYVQELQKYIDVDIYGKCGMTECPRGVSPDPCLKMLKLNYKFYLAFENSHCKDYITEKMYVNALWNDVVPVVMGARPEDYAVSAPPHSYIHVDDFASPRELAEYLYKLDEDDLLYNAYFKWKDTGEFINTKFWCRLCAMLHDDTRNAWYEDINTWWRGGNMCVHQSGREKWGTWRTVRDLKPKRQESLHYGERDESSDVVPKLKPAAVAMDSSTIPTTNKPKNIPNFKGNEM